ncbi:hypothetical protein BDV18DRAFT_95392 [Aspergillus unguis]
MPPLAVPLLPVHVPRAVAASNATDIGLDVVCAWPVSGQYGPGTRVLYYVFIAACVFARKEEWLRNACLAGALLFPAVAAVHGIVLASIHIDGAIHMDVYGAFQLCSIGILTAPLTARMSGTYFKDPRRNIIFLWTGLVLAGLLSITVELFRVKTSNCLEDDDGNPILSDVSKFPYEHAKCNIRCSVEDGPFSPIRLGATNEIYLIPAPNKLTFGTATLLAAACCVPAIVSLFYFWSLILRETWNNRYGNPTEDDPRDELIDGTNGATVGQMLHINGLVRKVLSTVEAPVFAAAVLAILIIGEKNFFSGPVDFGTEPIASIGQWAPIVGAGFAILGSLYISLIGEDENPNSGECKCTCQHDRVIARNSSTNSATPSSEEGSIHPEMATLSTLETAHTQPSRRETVDVGKRRWVNRTLMRFATALSIAAHDRLENYEFKGGRALDFPEIPGEAQRNKELQQIRDTYNPKRDSSGNLTLSRQGSTMSIASWRDGDRSSQSSRQSPRSRSPSPFPYSRGSGENDGSLDIDAARPTSPDRPVAATRKRQNTLEVPLQHVPTRRSPSISSISVSDYEVLGTPTSPAIIVSADDQETPPMSPRRETHPVPDTTSSESQYPDDPGPSTFGRRFTS